MSHEVANGYGSRPGTRPSIGYMPRRTFYCEWEWTDADDKRHVCGAAFESTSPNSRVCPKHRKERDVARDARRKVGR